MEENQISRIQKAWHSFQLLGGCEASQLQEVSRNRVPIHLSWNSDLKTLIPLPLLDLVFYEQSGHKYLKRENLVTGG